MNVLKSIIRIFFNIFIILNLILNLSAQTKRSNDPGEKAKSKAWNELLRKFSLPKDAIKLEAIHSFPSNDLTDKDVFLWKPLGITPLPNGNIVVNDQKASLLLMFDSQGKFIRKIGKKGQGPGEFGNPFCLSVTSEYIVVSDNSNMRLQFFDLEGNFIRSIRTFKAYLDIDVSGEEWIYAVPMRMHPDSALVEIINKDGKLLNSFGDAKFGNIRSNWQWPNMVKIGMNERGELFLAYESFPLICKYSKTGALLAEYKINHKRMEELEKINLNRIKDGTLHKGIFTVINSIHTNLDGFYILHNFPRVEILEYENNGKLRNNYYFEYESHDIYFQDFFVKEMGGEKTFYLLKTRPESEIIIFRPKRIISN